MPGGATAMWVLKATAHSRGICIGNVGEIAPCLPWCLDSDWNGFQLSELFLVVFARTPHSNNNLAGVGRTRAVVENTLDGNCALCAFWSNKLGFLLVHCGSSLLIVLIRHVWSCADNYLLEMTCTVLGVHKARCTHWDPCLFLMKSPRGTKDGRWQKLREQVRGRGCVWRPLNPSHIFFTLRLSPVELSRSEPNGLLGKFPSPVELSRSQAEWPAGEVPFPLFQDWHWDLDPKALSRLPP